MKTKLFSMLVAAFMGSVVWAQGVGINETGAAPDPAAILDVSSSNKVFLPPRITTTQRNAILNPPVGAVIFNTTTNCLQWFGGQTWYDGCSGQELWHPGYVHCNPANPTAVVEVLNPVTNRTWMDRNLGANRAAISTTDAEAYGSFFQWGRRSDGHQCVNRFAGDGVTTSLNTAVGATVSTDTPTHGNFIRTNTDPSDWRSPQNDNLWQGINGLNNPCPVGFRLPTQVEINAERLSWVQAPISSTNDANGAFASPLKFTLTGFRRVNTGLPNSVGDFGSYWTSTINGVNARGLRTTTTDANMNSFARGQGFSVRCIKN